MKELKEIRTEIEQLDGEMARLFEKRMALAEQVAACKKANGLKVTDRRREQELLDHNEQFIEKAELKSYYQEFFRKVLSLSRRYQKELLK